jgi:hypothetical protein
MTRLATSLSRKAVFDIKMVWQSTTDDNIDAANALGDISKLQLTKVI